MQSPFLETTREDFRVAHDISAYSLIAISRAAKPLLMKGTASSSQTPSSGGSAYPRTPSSGSIISLSYLGSQRVVPQYKVMGAAKASLEAVSRALAVDLGSSGIRVNTISAGPIETLAARGIRDFMDMKEWAAKSAPLKRGINLEDVGQTAAFLASDLASGITGQTIFVDCGVSALAALPTGSPS
jgi:enoyl-[acyl-carrier protein] reductase I